ncbi:MAG: hypothetical protein M1309_06090 [Actinobacteria bacterium]|nr:hypothetical protein [Actinomycetota bacterium]
MNLPPGMIAACPLFAGRPGPGRWVDFPVGERIHATDGEVCGRRRYIVVDNLLFREISFEHGAVLKRLRGIYPLALPWLSFPAG